MPETQTQLRELRRGETYKVGEKVRGPVVPDAEYHIARTTPTRITLVRLVTRVVTRRECSAKQIKAVELARYDCSGGENWRNVSPDLIFFNYIHEKQDGFKEYERLIKQHGGTA